jgi:NitT/TauT family transport system substrate-binding protein
MNKKIWAVALTVVMLAALLAGCGGKETAKQEQKPAAAKIAIAYTPWTGYGALFVAQEKGFFKNKGVEVEIQAIEGVGDRKQALVAGKIQAMAASLDVSVSAAGEGVPMKFVWAFDSSAGADGLIVKKDKGIHTIADLKGKQVAFHRGSASHFFLTTIMDKVGLKDKDVTVVDMKASEAASAFMAGKVDAAVTWEPHLTKAAAQGATILSTTKDTPGLIADVLAFREDFVKSNPEQVQAVVAALAEATDFIAKNPDEASKIMANAFKMKPEDVKADISTITFYDLKTNLAFYGTKEKPGAIYDVAKRAGQFYVDQKILTAVPDASQFIDNTFISKIK